MTDWFVQRVARRKRAGFVISIPVSRSTTLLCIVLVTIRPRLRRSGSLRHGNYDECRQQRGTLTSPIQKEFPYPLLSDPDRVLIAALGAKDAGSGKTKRAHFIFAKGGKLVKKELPVSPGNRYVIVPFKQLWRWAQQSADTLI